MPELLVAMRVIRARGVTVLGFAVDVARVAQLWNASVGANTVSDVVAARLVQFVVALSVEESMTESLLERFLGCSLRTGSGA